MHHCVLDSSVGPHCAATGASCSAARVRRWAWAASATRPGQIRSHAFAAPGGSVKHLGLPLSNQPAAAATALHTALHTDIVTKVETRIARWFHLSMLGRAYVAKQVLASMETYHATFVPVPRELLERLCRAIHSFVAANRPVTGSAAALFPGKATCFRAGKDGGIALVDLSAQILALQAKVLGRLLEPEQLAW